MDAPLAAGGIAIGAAPLENSLALPLVKFRNRPPGNLSKEIQMQAHKEHTLVLTLASVGEDLEAPIISKGTDR